MATTYQYEVYVDVEITFPRSAGGTYAPLGYATNELVVITSSRKLNDAFVCTNAIGQVRGRMKGTMPGSLVAFPMSFTCSHIYLSKY